MESQTFWKISILIPTVEKVLCSREKPSFLCLLFLGMLWRNFSAYIMYMIILFERVLVFLLHFMKWCDVCWKYEFDVIMYFLILMVMLLLVETFKRDWTSMASFLFDITWDVMSTYLLHLSPYIWFCYHMWVLLLNMLTPIEDGSRKAWKLNLILWTYHAYQQANG